MKRMNKEKIESPIENWSFTYINYWLFFIGITFVIVGYIVMHTGGTNSFKSLTLAPILLVLGYCLISRASSAFEQRDFCGSMPS